MNIYAKKGDQVAVTEESIKNGHDCDKQKAKTNLSVGEIYTVESTKAFSLRTEVHLQEFPNVIFNSVQFIDVILTYSNN